MIGKFTNFKDLTELGRLEIPIFQRNYVWNKDNFDDFVEDLLFYKENPQYGFIGTIILKKIDNKRYEIVDGQQRITSLTLFIISLTKRIEYLQHKNSEETGKRTSSKDVHRLTTYQDLFLHTDEYEPLLSPHENISNGFREIANLDWNPLLNEEHLEELRKSKDSIYKAYKEFQDLSENFGNSKTQTNLDDIFAMLSVIKDLNLNLLTTEDDEEAYYAFETTNSRGVGLEVQDQLRNHIFSGIQGQNQQLQVQKRWEEALKGIKNPAKMLRQFYFTKGGYISNKKLYKEIKKLEMDRMHLLDEIEDYSKFFKVLDNGGTKEDFYEYLDEIEADKTDQQDKEEMFISIAAMRDFGTIQAFPLIYAFLKTYKKLGTNEKKMNGKNLITFFQNIENFLFINYKVGTNRANIIETYTAKKSQEFNKLSSEKDFKVHTEEFYKWLEDQKDLKENFVSRFKDLRYEPSNLRNLRYIFSKHDTFLAKKGSNKISEIYDPSKKLTSTHDIDHWYPKKPNSLPELNDEEKHSIGNLISLYSRKNSSFKSETPNGKYLELIKKTSSLNFFTEDFLKSNFAKNNFKDWDKDKILERAKRLADLSFEEIWVINQKYYAAKLRKKKK